MEAPAEDFTGPLFEAMFDNVVHPIADASGRVGSLDDVPALVERRYGLGTAFEGFWMNGINSADPVPDEDFVVNDLTSEPIPASWDTEAAGGPLFYVAIMTDAFDGEEGYWVEFSRRAGDDPGFSVRRIAAPPEDFSDPRFQAHGNVAHPDPNFDQE